MADSDLLEAPADTWLGLDEAAAFLGISPITLRRWNSAGTGPRFYQLGSRYRYRRSDLDTWLEAQASDRTEVA